MKLDVFNTEVNKIWKNLSDGERINDNMLLTELEFYKNMLVFFQVGETFYTVFNFQQASFDFVSNDVVHLLGFAPEEYTVGLFMENIHPEDRTWFLNCQEVAGAFILGLPVDKQMKYKLRIDYRIKKKSGEYIRVMHQSIIAQNDDTGKIYRTLVIFTDITHLKQTGNPVLSYIGMEGEPSYYDIDLQNAGVENKTGLSKREQEVLYHLAEGRLSKEVADILSISKNTVDTHRKNMLHKMQVATTAELISKAIREGLI